MISFNDHYNAISIDRLPSKTKIGKDSWKRFTKKKKFLRKPKFSSDTQTSFLIKNTKNNRSSASDWWEYIKYRFKENVNILSKSSTTQKNITISRKNLPFLLKK